MGFLRVRPLKYLRKGSSFFLCILTSLLRKFRLKNIAITNLPVKRSGHDQITLVWGGTSTCGRICVDVYNVNTYINNKQWKPRKKSRTENWLLLLPHLVAPSLSSNTLNPSQLQRHSSFNPIIFNSSALTQSQSTLNASLWQFTAARSAPSRAKRKYINNAEWRHSQIPFVNRIWIVTVGYRLGWDS